jgi:hypothetical protein
MSNLPAARPFPQDLLEKAPAERKHYFKNKIVAHRSIHQAHIELMSTLNHPIGGQIVMVIGAPGIGKTTVRRAMVRDLTQRFLEQDNTDPGHLPVTGIELEAFQGGIFKWKKTRQTLLKALHEPLVNKQVIYHQRMVERDGKLHIDNRISADDLGEILVETLQRRRPQALWFDEGQHLARVSGAKGLLHQLDVIKSLANRSGVTTVLFGTYEMNTLLGLSPQLDRRIQRIHVPRYQATDPTDIVEFQQVLLAFQKHLPFPTEPDLLTHWTYFFAGSLGCVGILKDWLYQASGAAFDEGTNTLTRDMCEPWQQPSDVLVDMLQRITSGETHFKTRHSQIELHSLLGLPDCAAPLQVELTDADHQPTPARQPGRRLPTRDRIGHVNL